MARRSAVRHKLPPVPEAKFDYLPFKGGLDLETPPWEVPAGYLRDTLNYEIGLSGGYSDVVGYERFDGRTAPSSASYATLAVDPGGDFEVGDTITGGDSGATAKVIAVLPDYLVITQITLVFTLAEDLLVLGVAEGVTAGASVIDGASTAVLHAQYKNLAADAYRAVIAVVPGSGAVRGVWVHNDVTYAVRDDVATTGAAMYKSSTGGWAAVALGYELAFTVGGGAVGTAIAEGNTVTGSISTKTAVVARVVVESGSWSGMDAAGRLIFTAAPSGAFQAENLTVGGITLATIAGNATAITLLPGGHYETHIENIGGQLGTKRVYGCDGVNRGFEFDGTVYVPIRTGMTVDAPTHVKVHKSHLFFSFGSSAQHSGIGEPYKWSPVFGAAEITTGDTVTGFGIEPGAAGDAALAIYSQNHISILYGNSVADWNRVPYREEIGAHAHTIQDVGFSTFLDDRGVTTLKTSQSYGNFQHSTITGKIQRWIKTRRTSATGSCIVRDKNQYRLFFSDNSALYVTLSGGKMLGVMPVQLSHRITCITSAELTSGAEGIFFGSTDGMVYRMEMGTSFDGAPIDARLIFHFTQCQAFGWIKGFVSAYIEATGSGYATFEFSYELGYASILLAQPISTTHMLELSAARWDEFIWDQFIWDGASLLPTRGKLGGEAENISLIIRKNSDYTQPVMLTGARIRFIPRRQVR